MLGALEEQARAAHQIELRWRLVHCERAELAHRVDELDRAIGRHFFRLQLIEPLLNFFQGIHYVQSDFVSQPFPV